MVRAGPAELPRTTAPPWTVHLALIFVQLAFAGFHVVAKATLVHLPPAGLVALRALGATPVLVLLAWRFDRVRPRARELPLLAELGLLGVFGNQLLFAEGLARTTATSAALLMPSIPVFAAAIAFALGMERPRPLRVVGIGLAVAGAVVMIGPSSGGRLVGNLMVLANCLSYAGFLVLARRALDRLPPFTVIASAFLFGGAGLVLVGSPDLLTLAAQAPPAAAWWGLAYIVLVGTVFTYATNTWSVSRSTSTLVATYTTLQPLGATILATLFLGETPGAGHLVGGLLILAGLFAVSRRARPAGG